MFLCRHTALLFAAVCLFQLSSASFAQSAPEFSFGGVSRVRYENLDGQFRAGRSGSDKAIVMRSLLQGRAQLGRFSLNSEIQDSRAYLDDEGTPLSGSFVNSMEFLQAYVSVTGSFDEANTVQAWELKAGRFTLDLGSRRFVERNDYRNTINNYSGVHWRQSFAAAGTLDAFFVAPIDKLPRDREGLDRNGVELDQASDTRRFWGIHYQRPRAIGAVQLDLLVYGLEEKDGATATRDRSVYAPGFRLLLPRTRGRWDFELESAFRFGTISANTAPDSAKVDVRATMLHGEFGYTFDTPWNHRILLEYDLATGDDRATENYERYDRFYGTRRGDLGNTSIHGPLTRSNASIVGLRYMFSGPQTDGRVVFQHALLHSATDAWIAARHHDPLGLSGNEVGQTLDFRIRHWLLPERLRIDVGGSALWFGEFARQVPGGPEGSRTLYGYSSLEFFF